MSTEFLGDVHLGKRFETGVPLHRRGDRERMQWDQFRSALLNTTADLHIQVGDLFDKFVVPYTVVWEAAEAYKAAKQKNPWTNYALIRGNHDASRDLDKVSAFKIFTDLVRPYGITVVDEHPVKVQNHLLVPWHPVKDAKEMLADLHSERGAIAVGHWDVVMGDTNRIPVERLRELEVARAVTGHDHNKRDMVIDGLDVHVTGSMAPYSHGEDPEGLLYVTRTLAEVLEDPSIYRDKCLRVVIPHGETLDEPIDCLQLTIQRGEKDDVDLGEVDFEAFDLAHLFEQARKEVGLDEEFGRTVLNKLEEERAARG